MHFNPPSVESPRIFLSAGHPKAVVLVVHGLNNKPEVMDSIAQVLAAGAAEVFRAALTGHLVGSDAMLSVTPEQWKEDLYSVYLKARGRADELGVPLYFVGYSLGALVNSVLLGAAGSLVRYDRQVLLAPALRLRRMIRLIGVFGFLGKRFWIPSWNDPAHRAHAGIPMAAYDSLFSLFSEFRSTGYRGMNIPTLVLSDPEDELVDGIGIRETVGKLGLRSWNFLWIEGRDAEKLSYHHLITDSDVLGRETWEKMVCAIRGHFGLV